MKNTERREKYTKLLAAAFKQYFDDIHKYNIAEYLKKAEKYRGNMLKKC